MTPDINIIKGIHPGIILERELRKRNLPKGRFAKSVHEYPQTISAIINGTRGMNTSLSLKIEEMLSFDEGFLMILQVYHDIAVEKNKANRDYHPDLSKYRKVLFWDTDFFSIDWEKNKRSVIQRVFERGNETEINETIRFYGKESILELLDLNKEFYPSVRINAEQYLGNG